MQIIGLATLMVLLFSCGDERVAVSSVEVENFSDVCYAAYPTHPYFYEITSLPSGFNLEAGYTNNSILYMTEATNMVPFDDDQLCLFLTDKELETAFETYVDSSYSNPVIRREEYYPYERLVMDDYVLLLIGKRVNDAEGREYIFYLRTFTLRGEMMANFTFALWDEGNHQYFGGWILPGMKVKREFKNGDVELFEILPNGEIAQN